MRNVVEFVNKLRNNSLDREVDRLGKPNVSVSEINEAHFSVAAEALVFAAKDKSGGREEMVWSSLELECIEGPRVSFADWGIGGPMGYGRPGAAGPGQSYYTAGLSATSAQEPVELGTDPSSSTALCSPISVSCRTRSSIDRGMWRSEVPQQAARTDQLACIVVTYNPNLDVLARLLKLLPKDAAVVIVDNASDATLSLQIVEHLAEFSRCSFMGNRDNRGLAAAINQGVMDVCHRWPDIRYALLLDQDTEPRPGAIEMLLFRMHNLANADPPAACVGPALYDPTTALYHGFHKCDSWRWRRVYPTPGDPAPIQCSNLNGSGTLVSVALFNSLGGLDASLFIDHVDTEWSFRVVANGYGLYGVPDAIFDHRMGEASRRIWLFGWQVWPMRSPQRHYYLFRNAILLMRRDYVPLVWKAWAVLKLLLTATVQGVFDTQRFRQLRQMAKGIRHGFFGGLRNGWTRD